MWVSRVVSSLTIVVGTALLLPSLFLASVNGAGEVTDRIVAIVNKEIITMSELQSELVDEQKRLRARYRGAELNRRIAQKENDALNSLIETKVQVQEAKAKGFSVTDEEVQQALQKIGSDPQNNGLSESMMKRRIRERLLQNKILDFEVRRTVMVPDSEIIRYYENHKDHFLIPPTYRLRQILLLTKPGQDIGERQTRADSIYAALQANGDFGESALKYSDGPEAAERGVLGVVRQDELLEPIAEALKTMSPGDISRPIKTTLGFHIIAVDEVTAPKARPLEEVENDIKSSLYKKHAEDTYQRWLKGLKKKAFIEIKF